MAVVLPSDGSLLGRILFFLSILPFWLDDVIMTSPALLTDTVLTSSELLVILVGVALIGGFSYFNNFPGATQPNSLFGVGITILVTALLHFLTGLLQRFLELLNLVG
jgi:hypothetical protein